MRWLHGSRRMTCRLEPPLSSGPWAQALTADPMRVFGRVRARDVRSLASPVLEVVVSAGTRLISEGDEVGTFFVIRAGQAEMSRRGQTLGALPPATASARAIRQRRRLNRSPSPRVPS